MTTPKIGERVQYAEMLGARWWMGDVIDVNESTGVATMYVIDHAGARTIQIGRHHKDDGPTEGVWRAMSEA